MDLGLAGKVAIITGGASGMGACVGRLLAEEGVRVVLADIQVEKGETVASALRNKGHDSDPAHRRGRGCGKCLSLPGFGSGTPSGGCGYQREWRTVDPLDALYHLKK